MKGQNSEYYTELRLHDLEQPYLDAYESAIRIYNDMVEKTRDSYHASVKLAKSQVMELSAVFVCLVVMFLAIITLN
jgi:DNA mismatch repair ATPase MutS